MKHHKENIFGAELGIFKMTTYFGCNAVKDIKCVCVCFKASVNKVRVLVDAEYTYMNPALTLVTMAMMKKFNKDGAWIWNTYQCYLKADILLFLSKIFI